MRRREPGLVEPSSPGLTLVLLAGMPGTGRTALALGIGRAFGWPVIDKDSLKSPLLAAGIAEELAGPASYALSYALVLELGRDLLARQRLSVILAIALALPQPARRRN